MHEAAIIQSAIEMAIAQAHAAGAARLHRVRLRVGALSGVVPDALEFAYEAVCRGTMAAGSRLEIETVPAACWCRVCAMEFAPAESLSECPRCHGFSSELRRGRELELTSLEIS